MESSSSSSISISTSPHRIPPIKSSSSRLNKRKRLSPPAEAVRGKTCAICLHDVDGRRAAVIAGCMHAYCHDCLLRWTNCKRRCPLCNAEFESYYSNHNQIFSTMFLKFQLPPGSSITFSGSIVRLSILPRQMEVPRYDPPILRSFRGRDREEMILKWRASIYQQRLRAVPVPGFRGFLLQPVGLLSSSCKQALIKSIEPWIKRELFALLNDPDPTLIVYLVTGLFVSSIERPRRRRISSAAAADDDLLASLRRFLGGYTDMFWHELRCFAEYEYEDEYEEVYEEIVEYQPIED